jgi:hypothetical protein
MVAALGSDLRGAIYAAYAFSEKILGVDPWWYWADKEPASRTSVRLHDSWTEQVRAPTFKYRGWFINKEDLLSSFCPDPLRENVFSLEMLDRICETLLRLRGNMLIPATFVFADERCNEFVGRRGLALNIHHADVVGLNVSRWPPNVPFSYTEHPEIMERYWQECIDALKDKEVVWTVGYRGRGDEPFWEAQVGAPTTPQARGDLITRAIAKQVELIRKVQPNAPITTNIWMEGVKLYQDGLIKVPVGVTLIWPDNGAGLMRDGGRVQAGHGMYYHTMMSDTFGNLLSEFVPPERIYHEIGRYVRAGGTEYFLLNVSDVRAVPLSTECAMRLVGNVRSHTPGSDHDNEKTFLLNWSDRQFGAKVAADVANLYGKYFAISSRQPKILLGEDTTEEISDDQKEYYNTGFGTIPRGDEAPYTYLTGLSDKTLLLIREDKPLTSTVLKDTDTALVFASTNRRYFSRLLAKAQALSRTIPVERRNFYESHLLTAIGINLYLNEILEYYCRALQQHGAGDQATMTNYLEQSLGAANALFDLLRRAERGKWSAWYFGDFRLEHCRDLIRATLAAVRGEPPPPVRVRQDIPEYHYQERFKENFPLLYGPKAGRSTT